MHAYYMNHTVPSTVADKQIARPPTTVADKRIARPPTKVTAMNTPNTIMSRDLTGSTNVTTLYASNKLYVRSGATINGTIDTSLGQGIVRSSSSGVLSSGLIKSADILNLTVNTVDICDRAITSNKLAMNVLLPGAPTCDNTILYGEKQIANIGHVNRSVTSFVTKYVDSRLRGHCFDGSDSDSDCDEFDPAIFHIICPLYVPLFDYTTYVVETPSAVITMPRKKKEGHSVKFYNKSGESIVINSSEDRIMYNAMYARDGTLAQIVEDNRCIVFTYVYNGTDRSWSFDYF